MIMENLFPIPIGMFKYDEGLTEAQTKFLVEQPQRPNEGNTSSEDRYLLKQKKLGSLANFIDKCAHEYFMATHNPKHDVRLKVTQSWLNWTTPGQFHHRHAHPNSLISGCFYVSANKETDKIFLYRDGYQQIKFPPVDWNMYNSESWWFPVGTGDLIFFPSSLIHMVQPVGGEDTRISMAFNFFPVGHVGDENDLTALHLPK
jgi:uncharacterized protein (TIGR02466 family)